jgi:hypothetical protein
MLNDFFVQAGYGEIQQMYDEVPNTWMCELQTVDKAV